VASKSSRSIINFIVLLRVLSAFLIIISPLWGFLVFEFIDYWDAHFFINVAKTKWSYYQKLDKRLDVLGFLAMVLVGLTYGVFGFLLSLLIFRLIGQLLYEIVKKQLVLTAFPNLIEVFYIWFILLESSNQFVLMFLFAVKLIQEGFLHYFWPEYLRKNGYPAIIQAFGVKNKINWD